MDLSEVAPGLYIASRFYPEDADMPRHSVPIDCTLVLRDDATSQRSVLDLLSEAAFDLWYNGAYNVVLICDAGRNRSAVIAAKVLMLRGASAEQAIKTVRAARDTSLGRTGGALTNSSFVDYLERAL